MVLLTISALLVAGCEKCSGTNIEKTGEAVVWESIPFHISESEFLTRSASLMGMDEAAESPKACKAQFTMAVPDLDEKAIRERIAGDKHLSVCTVRAHNTNQTSTLLETKGEFVSQKLSRITYRFAGSHFVNVKATLQSRFGAGDSMTVKEQIIIEENPSVLHYWRDTHEVWLLSKSANNTALLIHQDLATGEALEEQAPASKKGEAVSLEDIGIGKLDLNAPLPSLDGILPPDGGVKDEAPSPPTENSETQP